MSISKRRSSRLSATFRCAAGLAVVMGLSVASYAAPISLSASDTGQGNPLGTWASQPQNPNISLWLTKSVDPTPNGPWFNWGSFGYLKFDVDSITIPTGQAVSAAAVVLVIKPNKDAADSGYVDLYQIKPEAQDWHAADIDPYTLTWAGVGKYYGDRVGTVFLSSLPKASDEKLTVTIPIRPEMVQGWLDGSIANRGLEIWFRPASTGGGLNVMGPDTPANSPVLSIDFAPVPEPTTGLLLMCGGMLVSRRRRRSPGA